jgi:hypothetical protein
VSDPTVDDEPPASPTPAPPEEPQTSVHAQTVQPEPAEEGAPAAPAERARPAPDER